MGDMNKPRNMHINQCILKNQRLPTLIFLFIYLLPGFRVWFVSQEMDSRGVRTCPVILTGSVRTISSMKTVTTYHNKNLSLFDVLFFLLGFFITSFYFWHVVSQILATYYEYICMGFFFFQCILYFVFTLFFLKDNVQDLQSLVFHAFCAKWHANYYQTGFPAWCMLLALAKMSNLNAYTGCVK